MPFAYQNKINLKRLVKSREMERNSTNLKNK